MARRRHSQIKDLRYKVMVWDPMLKPNGNGSSTPSVYYDNEVDTDPMVNLNRWLGVGNFLRNDVCGYLVPGNQGDSIVLSNHSNAGGSSSNPNGWATPTDWGTILKANGQIYSKGDLFIGSNISGSTCDVDTQFNPNNPVSASAGIKADGNAFIRQNFSIIPNAANGDAVVQLTPTGSATFRDTLALQSIPGGDLNIAFYPDGSGMFSNHIDLIPDPATGIPVVSLLDTGAIMGRDTLTIVPDPATGTPTITLNPDGSALLQGAGNPGSITLGNNGQATFTNDVTIGGTTISSAGSTFGDVLISDGLTASWGQLISASGSGSTNSLMGFDDPIEMIADTSLANPSPKFHARLVDVISANRNDLSVASINSGNDSGTMLIWDSQAVTTTGGPFGTPSLAAGGNNGKWVRTNVIDSGSY